MNTKANTIIEKFGFKDDDLKTPEHDKMLLWLNENWLKVVTEFELLPTNEEELKNAQPKITIEIPVMGGYRNNYNIGFIDLAVEYQLKTYTMLFFFEIKPEIKSIGEIIRQINFYRSQYITRYDRFGNTGIQPIMRGKFILFTKTKGLKELFKQQDIYVYEYNEND